VRCYVRCQTLTQKQMLKLAFDDLGLNVLEHVFRAYNFTTCLLVLELGLIQLQAHYEQFFFSIALVNINVMSIEWSQVRACSESGASRSSGGSSRPTGSIPPTYTCSARGTSRTSRTYALHQQTTFSINSVTTKTASLNIMM